MSEINIFKKINRNAFNEKLIHRYLFERYYFGDSQQRQKLLPDRLRNYQINLIVPEGTKTEERYRVDLEIFFKNMQNSVPVEVKWQISNFKKDNQKNYIKQKQGFVVVLGKTDKKYFENIDVVIIDHEDFSDWIAENISRLSRESLIYRASSVSDASKSQYWVVFLKGGPKGSAVKNFDRMLKSQPLHPFWAFRQHPKALPHILDMQKGDTIIFLFASTLKGGMAHSKNPKTSIKIHRFYICEIVEPYYMVLDDNRGLFFEDQIKKPSIGDRRWPHFIDFTIKRPYEGPKELLFGPQGKFSESFANSFNHGGGTPYPLSRSQYELLKDKLIKLSKEIE
ncbi:MAG: hypothetical protein GYA31_01585 [Parcubacteria group bacterium]|nr:hypothetical protein [Parcubacteria group bacterium]